MRFANRKKGDPPPIDLKEYCRKIMTTHPYFIGHPNRKIMPWPTNTDHPQELFIECRDDQIMASQMQILISHLTDDLGELEFYGYDLALDVNGRTRRLTIFFQEDDHGKMETQIKFYPFAKDIQRIEAANMNLPIRTPEDALIVAQIMDFRIDLAGQLIHLKNTNKALSKALHDALVRIGELEAQIDVLADTALLRRFKMPSAIKSYISLAAQFPEEYGDLLTSADKSWANIGSYCQTSACILGVVSFFIGIIVMYWISKMGKREGFKHILKYIVFVAVIILIVEFIFHFLSK